MKNLTALLLIIICLVLTLPLCLAQEVTFSDQLVITTDADEAKSVFSADLDGDGDYDVLSASHSDHKIAWYENTDGLGSFGPQQIITTSASGAESVFSTDLDGDGDYDVLSASWIDSKIAWYENTDGLGSFGPQQIITTNADGARSVFSADLDGDGNYDVLSASREDDKIAWYENTDGLGSFGPQQIITTSANGAMSVFSADLDGDGDYDVLSASRYDYKIAWYENTSGEGSFGPQQIITNSADQAMSVFSADLDGDGDYDVLSASHSDHKIAWYENTDGLGSFGPQQIITTSALGAWSVFSADLDGDGDYDILSASEHDNKIAWYENTDGLGSFGPQQIITTWASGARSVFSADLDGDGNYDVLSASVWDDKIAWYCNEIANGQLEDLVLEAIPWTDPTWIGPAGGWFRWHGYVTSESDDAVLFDAWIEVVLPNGNIYGPLGQFLNITIPPNQVIHVTPFQWVPDYAPAGVYTYVAKVGTYPDAVMEDSFEFEKLEGQAMAAHHNGWMVTGWFGDEAVAGSDMAGASTTEDNASSPPIPNEFGIAEVYPNPFNPSTTVTVSLPEATDLRVNIINVTGRQVADLACGHFPAGYHSFTFDGSELSSGIYFFRTSSPHGWSEVRKAVLMK